MDLSYSISGHDGMLVNSGFDSSGKYWTLALTTWPTESAGSYWSSVGGRHSLLKYVELEKNQLTKGLFFKVIFINYTAQEKYLMCFNYISLYFWWRDNRNVSNASLAVWSYPFSTLVTMNFVHSPGRCYTSSVHRWAPELHRTT